MKHQPHILVLPQWYPNKTDIQLGGFIRQQVQLMANDFKISVIYVQGIIDQAKLYKLEDSENNGVREIIVYFKQNKGPLRKLINYQRFKKAQLLAFTKVREEVNLIHIHVPMRAAILGILLNRSKTPLVITEHWSGHLNGQFNQLKGIEKNIYLDAVKRAKAITTVSPALQKAFKKNTEFDAILIPNPIKGNPKPILPIEERIAILAVGDLNNTTKNYVGLLNGLKKALEIRDDLHLRIIGDGPDKALIESTISNLQLMDHVELVGRLSQEEVQNQFKNTHFLVSNSTNETFGMAIAESIANGRPVVCTRCGGPEEFVNERNGIMIETNNDEALAHSILEMSDRFINYDSLAMSNEILALYGEEVVKSRWLKFYHENLK